MGEMQLSHASGRNILIIEDDLDALRLLSDILTAEGFEVRPSSDGVLGMRSAKSKVPDLVLLDINLPDINGVEVCRFLRANEATSRVPVIFISGLDQAELKAVAIKAGGNDFITKPIEAALLVERVNTLLGLHQLKREMSSTQRVLQAESRAREDAEARLEASEKKFRTTFELAPIGIAHVAPDGSWLQVNSYLCTMMGYSRDELLARSFQDITHPDDLEADLAYVKQMLSGERDAYSMEKRYLRKDGRVIWGRLSVSMVRRDDTSPEYFISIIENLTDRNESANEQV